MNLLFTALIVVWAAWLILKKYKPQTVLFVAGGLLLAGSMIMNWGTILPAGKSTGMWSFDIFELIRTLFANRLSGLGLNIMAVGGFARYMDKIGASNALVALTIHPSADAAEIALHRHERLLGTRHVPWAGHQ